MIVLFEATIERIHWTVFLNESNNISFHWMVEASSSITVKENFYFGYWATHQSRDPIFRKIFSCFLILSQLYGFTSENKVDPQQSAMESDLGHDWSDKFCILVTVQWINRMTWCREHSHIQWLPRSETDPNNFDPCHSFL